VVIGEKGGGWENAGRGEKKLRGQERIREGKRNARFSPVPLFKNGGGEGPPASPKEGTQVD